MEEVDCLIVGAGVIGLATARAFAQARREVLILEQEGTFGTHASSRNNEVIHAGFLYPPSSLRAQLCLEGRDMLYRFCKEHGVASRKTGKYVIATDEAEEQILGHLHRAADGIAGLELEELTGAEVRAREPDLACRSAIFSPHTGIVDSHGLMLGLLGDAENAGAVMACRARAESIAAGDRGVLVRVAEGTKYYELRCGVVINASGFSAASLSGDRVSPHETPIRYAKGSFFSYAGKSPFGSMVVPIGATLAAGAAFTFDLGGQGKFGPDVEFVDRVDYSVSTSHLEARIQAIRRFYPMLEPSRLIPAYSGIRPRNMANGGDWIVHLTQPVSGGLVVDILGMDTPGLTACIAIAEHALRIVEEHT